MVRKRSRKGSSRRNTRKYDSDENDSDSDIDLNSPPSSPARKRYGLRQRKQPIFFQDFDYDEDDELNAGRKRSDDDEFDVQSEVKVSHVEYPRGRHSGSTETPTEPGLEKDNEEEVDGALIDYEDMIRADVVMNKQKAECNSNSVVNRTVSVPSSVCKTPGGAVTVVVKGRRGRKPKVKLDAHIQQLPVSSSSYVPDDTKVEIQIDPMNFVRADLEEPCKTNGVKRAVIPDKQTQTPTENGSTIPIMIAPSTVEGIEKYVPPELDEKEKEVILSNEYLLGNSFDMSADEFLEKQALKTGEPEKEEENVPLINFDEDSGSSDDVILIEKKPEIIVLDDDD